MRDGRCNVCWRYDLGPGDRAFADQSGILGDPGPRQSAGRGMIPLRQQRKSRTHRRKQGALSPRPKEAGEER